MDITIVIGAQVEDEETLADLLALLRLQLPYIADNVTVNSHATEV